MQKNEADIFKILIHQRIYSTLNLGHLGAIKHAFIYIFSFFIYRFFSEAHFGKNLQLYYDSKFKWQIYYRMNYYFL